MNFLEFIGAGTVIFFLYIIYASFKEKRVEKITEDERDIGLLLTYHKHFNKMLRDFREKEETKYRETRAQIKKRIEQEKQNGTYYFDEEEYKYINHRGYDLYDTIVWVDNRLIVEEFKKRIQAEIAEFKRDNEKKEVINAILTKVKSPDFRD